MIAITAILKSKPENTAKILEMVTHLISETRKESACKRYDLHYNETNFIIWEEWENQEGLDLHNQSAHLQNFVKQSKELLDGSLEVYKTTQGV